MKSGETNIQLISIPVDISLVEKVYFTYMGKQKVVKEYPTEVTHDGEHFVVPFTQADTIALCRSVPTEVKVEQQIVFKDKAVAITKAQSITVSPSINPRVVDGNKPNENQLSDLTFSVDGDIVLVSGGSSSGQSTDLSAYLKKSELGTEIADYVEEHKAELKGEKGDKGADGQMDMSLSPIYDTSGFNKSSIDVMHDMKIGINLGNYFDSCIRGSELAKGYAVPTGINDYTQYYETLWGNIPVSEKLIKYLANIGIMAIRLPVTWYNLYDDNYCRVSELYLARIKEVVDLIINNGMYCIINMHHDGYSRTNKTRLILDDDHELTSMKYYSNVWKQVSEYFADYGYKLLFESMNEACDYGGSMTAKEERTNVAKKFHNEFLQIVRNSGGNNANRFVVLPNYAGLSLMNMSGIVDSATDKILATGHDYKGSANGTVTALDNYVKSNGIGCIMDECGVEPSDSTTYAKELRKLADEKNVSTFWWDNGQREFNLFNRYYCEPTSTALGDYVGKELPLNVYTEPKDRTQPYVAKFKTEDCDGIWGKKYVMICSQNPITKVEVATKNTDHGYYDLIGIDGGLFTTYISDDGLSWTICETRIATSFSRVKWGGFNLYGSTVNTELVESNYTLTMPSNSSSTDTPTDNPSDNPSDDTSSEVKNIVLPTWFNEQSGYTGVDADTSSQYSLPYYVVIHDENADTYTLLITTTKITSISNEVETKSRWTCYLDEQTDSAYKYVYYKSINEIGDFSECETPIKANVSTINNNKTQPSITGNAKIVKANYDIDGYYTVI